MKSANMSKAFYKREILRICEELKRVNSDRYDLEKKIKSKELEIESLKANQHRAQSYISNTYDTLRELRGILISSKFIDDRPKTVLTFQPHDYYDRGRPPLPKPEELCNRDEIMIRFNYVVEQINSIRVQRDY